jgi:glyoxylase-like metal-dependent hydrolase (beta-lactamase superfamily II)
MKIKSNFTTVARICATTLVGLLLTAALPAVTINFDLDSEAPGSFRFRWIHGSISLQHNVDPRIHVQRYNAHTFVMRQNKAINFEAPFMYLFFGNDKALLIDTGATANPQFFPIRETVDKVITRWLHENGKASIKLIVAQTATDAHNIQGHGQFEGRPDTEFIGMDLASIREFAGIDSWPDSMGMIDLGGRTLTVIPSPGMSLVGLSFYDPYTRWIVTGPVIKPGRLWITRWAAYRATIERLQTFASEHPVLWLMGNAIEMSYRPAIDYRLGATYQPTEALLQMNPEVIGRITEALAAKQGFAGIDIHDDFILMYGVPRGARSYGFPNPTPARFKPFPTGGLR